MPLRQFLISLFLLLGVATWVNADKNVNPGAPPAAWSSAVEKQLVGMVAGNAQATQVYSHVVKRLRRSGVPVAYVWRVFSDPIITVDPIIAEKLEKPAEHMDYDDYRQIFVNSERINAGVSFYRTHETLLTEISNQYGVDPYLILSFIGVETKYGQYTAKFPVFNSLHTIIHQKPYRAKWAEDEMVAWFMICRVDGFSPLGVMGSYAGAFGYGQFMPTSFKRYAVDMDGDGVREPYEWADVMASIANYLLKRGKYQTGSTDFSENSANWRAVYKYNPSKNYVRAVLELRAELKQAIIRS